MQNLKIALCQHDIVWEDARATTGRIEGPVRRYCAKYHPDLLIFPEAFSVGFTMNPSVAEPVDGHSAAWLRRIARECGAAVIASVPTVVTAEDGEHRYNRCWFITPDGQEYVNTTGNPGLAKGGSGDVLTGLVGGLLARGYDNFTAAALGVWIHGYAGDSLTETCTAEAYNSRDLIDSLYLGFKSLM